MDDMTQFGYHLRALRQQRKRSQRALAQAAGIAVSFLSKIEAGKASPTLVTLMKLAESLGLTVVELLSPSTLTPTPLLVVPEAQMHVVDDGERRWRYFFPQHPHIHAVMIDELYRPRTQHLEVEQHPHDICGIVQCGTLTLEMPMQAPVQVREGEAFYIRAGTPHRACNATDVPLHLLSVELLNTEPDAAPSTDLA